MGLSRDCKESGTSQTAESTMKLKVAVVLGLV